MAKIYGIDVSHHQGEIDWNKVKASGIKFAIIRVGYSARNGKGGLVFDKRWKTNIEYCNKINLPVGVYVYCYDTSASASAKTMADCVNAIKKYKIEYPVVYDIEYDNKSLLKATNTDIVRSALKVVENAGYYAVVYASRDFFTSHLILSKLSDLDKWEAAYTQEDTAKVPNGIWQYSSKGRVPGINGNVDLDVAYKDYPALIRKAGLNHLNDTAAEESQTIMVNVTAKKLNIRTGPGTNYPKTGEFTGVGTFEITEEQSGVGSNLGWGKLADGRGWISLDIAKKV